MLGVKSIKSESVLSPVAENPQYDVAISFLSEDQTLAEAIYSKLSEGLRVFFYPGSQEVLAGTDGLESMRKPFFDDSRVVVVLYREKWGKTPWTRVEQTAIEDSFLKYGWERLFFIVLDKSDELPIWLPHTRVRYNFADFGMNQVVGAIKARVQDQGGKNMPMTALKSAEIYQTNERFRQDKLRMNSEAGIRAINESVAELFHHIEQKSADIDAKEFLKIRCEISLKEGNDTRYCAITNEQIGLAVSWNQPFANDLGRSELVISEYGSGLILLSQLNRLMPYDRPRPINEAKYLPDLSVTREYGWRRAATESEFVSCAALGEQIVLRFVELANRKASGKMKR